MKPSDSAFAAAGAVTGFGALFAGAACCVLPLALAGVGIGAGGLASLGPLRLPLAGLALLAVAAGWYVHLRRRRACRADASCAPPSRATASILLVATGFVVLSGLWPYFEPPLMRLFAR